MITIHVCARPPCLLPVRTRSREIYSVYGQNTRSRGKYTRDPSQPGTVCFSRRAKHPSATPSAATSRSSPGDSAVRTSLRRGALHGAAIAPSAGAGGDGPAESTRAIGFGRPAATLRDDDRNWSAEIALDRRYEAASGRRYLNLPDLADRLTL